MDSAREVASTKLQETVSQALTQFNKETMSSAMQLILQIKFAQMQGKDISSIEAVQREHSEYTKADLTTALLFERVLRPIGNEIYSQAAPMGLMLGGVENIKTLIRAAGWQHFVDLQEKLDYLEQSKLVDTGTTIIGDLIDAEDPVPTSFTIGPNEEQLAGLCEKVIQEVSSPALNKKEKAERLDKLFQILRLSDVNSAKEIRELARVLHRYTKYCAYAQVRDDDKEGGMKEGMQLMFHSIALLCNELDITSNWRDYSSLHLLATSGEIDQEVFFRKLLEMDPKEVRTRATSLGVYQELVDALIYVAYTTQNIGAYNQNLSEQKPLSAFIDAMIGNETLEDRRKLLDFQYNRVMYLAALEFPGDRERIAASQDPLLKILPECHEPTSREYMALRAKILNRSALHLIKTDPAKAEPVIKEADQLRRELLKTAAKGSEDEDDQRYYLANLTTAHIVCIAAHTTLTDEDRAQLLTLVDELNMYIQDMRAQDDTHFYSSSYEKAIQVAQDALLR